SAFKRRISCFSPAHTQELRLERMIAKELRNSLRRAVRILVAARVDPRHHRSRAGRSINRTSVSTGRAFACDAIDAPGRFDRVLLVRKPNRPVPLARDVK